MKVAVSIACMALLSGCQSVPPAYGEVAWQALHAVDTAQTLHIARAPECYYERAPLTRALVGAHPSEAEVAAVMVGYALLHRYLTDHLEGRWLRVYQAASFINTARNVARNHNIGLRPFGRGCACCGKPHSFTEYDDDGKYVRSGPNAEYVASWD